MTIEEAIRTEIMNEMPAWVIQTPLAHTVLELARRVETSPDAYVAGINRELRLTLDELRKRVDKAKKPSGDGSKPSVDELAERRKQVS